MLCALTMNDWVDVHLGVRIYILVERGGSKFVWFLIIY